MQKFLARDRNHLEQLIKESIAKEGLNCDLNFIDVSNITDMFGLFWDSAFNGKIDEWNVSKVTDMGQMFYRSEFTGDISKWDVSKVQSMSAMFCDSSFNGDVCR